MQDMMNEFDTKLEEIGRQKALKINSYVIKILGTRKMVWNKKSSIDDYYDNKIVQVWTKKTTPEDGNTFIEERQLLLEIPMDFMTKLKELFVHDFRGKKIASWAIGRRKEGQIENLRIDEMIVPPTVCCPRCTSNESKISPKHLVGIIMTNHPINFPLRLKKKLANGKKYVIILIGPDTETIQFKLVKFAAENNPQEDSNQIRTIHLETDIVTKVNNKEIIITDCRPRSEKERHKISSLGDPFMPTGNLRQLTATTYVKPSL